MNDDKNAAPDPNDVTSHEPKVFDFSSDLSISPIADEPKTSSPTGLPKDVSREALRAISEQMKPKEAPSRLVQQTPEKMVAPEPPAPPKPVVPVAPTTAPTPRPVVPTPPPIVPAPIVATPVATTPTTPVNLFKKEDPFRENITDIKTSEEWPFATQATVNKSEASSTPAKPPEPTEQLLSKLKPRQENNSSILKPIRTYENDIAQVLANRGTTKVSMAIAESKRRGEGESVKASVQEAPVQPQNQSYEEPSHWGMKTVITIICLILIGAGGAGGYYLYSKSPIAAIPAKTTQPKTLPSLVPSDSQVTITTDSLSSGSIINKIKSEVIKSEKPDSIKEIVLTEIKDSNQYRVSAMEMPGLIGLAIPDIIYRTLLYQWMLGVYSNPMGEQSVFVVVETNLFQNAFAGMLAWESAMPADLKNFLSVSSNNEAIPTPRGQFKDQIIKNKDVRALVTIDGRTVFVYSFIDDSTLIVAQSNDVLSAIITRLENKAFVR